MHAALVCVIGVTNTIQIVGTSLDGYGYVDNQDLLIFKVKLFREKEREEIPTD